MPEALIFILFAALMITAVIWGIVAARKRRQALAELAARLGLSFRTERDHRLADGFSFLNKLKVRLDWVRE